MAAMSSTPSPPANALRPNSYACCKEDSPIPAIESRNAAVYWSSSFSMVSRMVNLFQIACNEHESVVRTLAVLGQNPVGDQLRWIAHIHHIGKVAADAVRHENQRISPHNGNNGCIQRRELVTDHAATEQQRLLPWARRRCRTHNHAADVSNAHPRQVSFQRVDHRKAHDDTTGLT